MSRVDDMLSRLPELYQDGSLVRGLLGLPAVQIEILQEEALAVQRAHFFDQALQRDEVVRLAAPLGIAAEDWQDTREYRAWVHSLRNAMLQKGAVTRGALQQLVAEYAGRYQRVTGIQAVAPIDEWSNQPSTSLPAFVENPALRRVERLPRHGDVEPLAQFSVEQRGLDATEAGLLLVGLPGSPEFSPVLINVTTGDALIYLGVVGVGQRLWLMPREDGGLRAELEGEDVSARVRRIENAQPGTPWKGVASVAERALPLARGRNDFWFLPLAHYDERGLDRFLLALPDLLMHQGRFDETDFDQALFSQPPLVRLWMTWNETRPASFDIELPAGTLLSRVGERDEALEARERLEFSLQLAVQKSRAAGVSSRVELRSFGDAQPQSDRLTAIFPLQHRETGVVGSDRLPDSGALFEVTDYDESTYR